MSSLKENEKKKQLQISSILKKSKNVVEVNVSCAKIDQSFEEPSSNKICDKQESSERVGQVDSYVKNREKVSFVGMKPLQVEYFNQGSLPFHHAILEKKSDISKELGLKIKTGIHGFIIT